jgi:SNF2 family DNA or RNA helicase
MKVIDVVQDTAVHIKVPSKDLQAITNDITKYAILSDDGTNAELAVYFGIQEMQRLTKMYGDAPNPILKKYSWPGIYTPFEHQKTTAAFLALRTRAFCFNEAGTGKTSSVIWAADYLMNEGLIKRVLIVCPLSIMYSAWRADIFKTAMHRTVDVAHGPTQKRQRIINGSYEFVIINFDGLGTVLNDIAKARFDLIVIDEANAYKTVSTKRWKTLASLITPATRLWMMTGTPASQSPVDAYGLAKLVSPGNVPRYATAWRDMVMNQVSRFKWLPKADSKQKVYSVLQPAIRFSKEECLDLPEITYQTRFVPMSNQVYKYYSILKKEMLIEAAGEEISAVNAAAQLSKLLQLSGGAVYTDKKEVVEFDVGTRLSTLLEVIEETQNKIVVFVPFRHTIDIVSEFLTRNSISNEIIQGYVTATNRAAIIDRFQTQVNPRVLVIQPQSASHGVTLTAADTVVFWSPVMSVETYLQCVARIDRVGQKNKMTVVHIEGSEAERKMYEMLQKKVNLHEGLVDLYKQELGI